MVLESFRVLIFSEIFRSNPKPRLSIHLYDRFYEGSKQANYGFILKLFLVNFRKLFYRNSELIVSHVILELVHIRG